MFIYDYNRMFNKHRNHRGYKSMKKYIDKFHLWHLMYRTEIIIFTIGFICGAIIL